jgi:putative alpha-1,2-mannosidase
MDFRNRSKFYKNVWNNATKFFDPRYKNGTFFTISKQERIDIFSNHYV